FHVTGVQTCALPISDAAMSAKTIRHQGEFLTASLSTPINVESAITIFAASATVRWDITLHNPNAALHRNGLWDLGDEGSLRIKRSEESRVGRERRCV